MTHWNRKYLLLEEEKDRRYYWISFFFVYTMQSSRSISGRRLLLKCLRLKLGVLWIKEKVAGSENYEVYLISDTSLVVFRGAFPQEYVPQNSVFLGEKKDVWVEFLNAAINHRSQLRCSSSHSPSPDLSYIPFRVTLLDGSAIASVLINRNNPKRLY